MARSRFDEFLKAEDGRAENRPSDSEKEALFKQFQAWEAEQNARAQVRTPPKQKLRLRPDPSGLKRSGPAGIRIVGPPLQCGAGGLAMLRR